MFCPSLPVHVREKAEVEAVFGDELAVADDVVPANAQHRAVQRVVLRLQVAESAVGRSVGRSVTFYKSAIFNQHIISWWWVMDGV